MFDLQRLKQDNPIVEIAEKLGLELKGYDGNTKVARCFSHDDKKPSLVFYPRVNRYECKGCGIKGDVFDLLQAIKGLDFKEAVKYLDPNIQFQKHPTTPKDYLESRGITKKTQSRFGLRIEDKTLVIPLPTGEKYRKFDGSQKYIHKPGTSACLFKTLKARKRVILTEGEIDAITVYQHTGYPAWSTTCGAETFKKEWVKDFEGFEKIFVAYDNDEAGQQGAEKAAELLGIDRCFKLEVPKHIGKDWSDYFSLGFSKEDFDRILKQAKSFKAPTFLERVDAEPIEEYRAFSGFSSIDKVVKGFRDSGVYLIAGLEKCGKTSFLMNIAHNLIKNGDKIGYINTELNDKQFVNKMASIWKDLPIDKVSADRQARREWAMRFQSDVLYAGVNDLTTEDGVFDFKKSLVKARSFLVSGIRVLFWDNLTTYSTQSTDKRRGWEVLAGCISKIVSLSKESGIISFLVIHTRPETVFSETPQGIRKFILANKPEKILDESVTVVRRPSLSDVYGGGGALSQLSGSILIWRPFQKFSFQSLRKLSLIILDSFRDSPSGINIKMEFQETRGIFKEVQTEEIEGGEQVEKQQRAY